MQSKAFNIILTSVFLAVALACQQQTNPVVVIETVYGNIEVEIYEDEAPVTAGNFLRYVDDNMWGGASFYRVVTSENQPDDDIRIQVVQGGLGWEDSLARFDPISHETTLQTGIMHENGVISMARDEPGSASSEFFICIGDQPSLDYGGLRNPDGQGFAAFGKVSKGMDVLHEIHQQPENEQMLDPVIPILGIYRK